MAQIKARPFDILMARALWGGHTATQLADDESGKATNRYRRDDGALFSIDLERDEVVWDAGRPSGKA